MIDEIVRWVGICGCSFIIGMNIAFMMIDKNPNWRWFLTGKTMLTLYVGVDIWIFPFNWTILLALLGITITSIAMVRSLLIQIEIETKIQAKIHPEAFGNLRKVGVK